MLPLFITLFAKDTIESPSGNLSPVNRGF